MAIPGSICKNYFLGVSLKLLSWKDYHIYQQPARLLLYITLPNVGTEKKEVGVACGNRKEY